MVLENNWKVVDACRHLAYKDGVRIPYPTLYGRIEKIRKERVASQRDLPVLTEAVATDPGLTPDRVACAQQDAIRRVENVRSRVNAPRPLAQRGIKVSKKTRSGDVQSPSILPPNDSGNEVIQNNLIPYSKEHMEKAEKLVLEDGWKLIDACRHLAYIEGVRIPYTTLHTHIDKIKGQEGNQGDLPVPDSGAQSAKRKKSKSYSAKRKKSKSYSEESLNEAVELVVEQSMKKGDVRYLFSKKGEHIPESTLRRRVVKVLEKKKEEEANQHDLTVSHYSLNESPFTSLQEGVLQTDLASQVLAGEYQLVQNTSFVYLPSLENI